VWLSSDWFIDFTDLKMKNHKPNKIRSASICSDRFQTEPNKVGYFFGLVRFELPVSLVLSEPLTPLLPTSGFHHHYLILNFIVSLLLQIEKIEEIQNGEDLDSILTGVSTPKILLWRLSWMILIFFDKSWMILLAMFLFLS